MSGLYFKIWVLLIFFAAGCGTKNTRTSSSEKGVLLPVSYAKGFRIEKFQDYEKISILSPWQKSEGIILEYFLVSRNKKIPDLLKGKQIIRTPIQRIICLSTSHLGFLSALKETETLRGLSGTGFVSDTSIRTAIKENRIKDVGYDQGLNYEVILGLKPDLIMAYGVGAEVNNVTNKLKDLNLNVLLNGEYLEETPLAKTEWIKLSGALYEKETQAFSYFEKIEKDYLEIKNKVKQVKSHPLVLTGLPYKDSWWMAGGKSNLAQLISDAGGEFIWKENASREAFVVSMEEVIIRATQADYWINCGTVSSIADLLSVDNRFSSFPQVKKKTIFNNNLAVNKEGGNDYWEKGVVRPDLILSDLVKIFHPEIDSSHCYNFYRKIE